MTGDAGTRARLPDLPARVGSFAVLRTLGEGASGVVVLAYDETFNHRVALKILYPRAGDSPELRERVIAGARTLMLLSHPNLARVHDVGEFQGQLYVATEFVPGITLSEWIEADSPSWDEVLDMYLQAGRGLAAAHAAGVLHGDFKPEHLMVRSDGRLLVIDFSPPRVTVIADSLPDGRVSVSSRELSISPSALDDAPEYMSPEQFLGHPCDARSEQFAYCAALWRGLMGERAFEGDSYDDRAHSVVNGRINAPPRRSLIPPWIVDVLRRGMSTSPADRYPSMDALVDALSIASSATVTRSRAARWLDPVIIGVLFCVISLALFKAINADFSIFPLPADTIAAEQIDASARAAREAAARRDWVYPRAGAPGDTALRHVLAIEQVKRKDAKDRAEALRRELAGQLRALGDVHWELEGGRGFARDFYLQALMFTREDESLLRRAGVSVGAQEELLEKAESGSFSTAELAAAEPLRILAEPDAGRRDEQLLEYLQRVDDLPGATRANLMALTGWGARAREPELGAATTGAGADAARVPAAPDEARRPRRRRGRPPARRAAGRRRARRRRRGRGRPARAGGDPRARGR
ncbi:MAG: serine/threonine protein kinase [Myxococcales bacterium]|nr:serine/threonine protein kinase [Myxococcales bacterium]